jgi:hypothetical protein
MCSVGERSCRSRRASASAASRRRSSVPGVISRRALEMQVAHRRRAVAHRSSAREDPRPRTASPVPLSGARASRAGGTCLAAEYTRNHRRDAGHEPSKCCWIAGYRLPLHWTARVPCATCDQMRAYVTIKSKEETRCSDSCRIGQLIDHLDHGARAHASTATAEIVSVTADQPLAPLHLPRGLRAQRRGWPMRVAPAR